jgi:hypothetical protein
MQTLTWRAQDIISQLRDRIWLYLSPASAPQQALEAAALLQMDSVDVLRLARLHFLLSDQAEELLSVVPSLLRRLPTTTLVEEERSTERIRGAVHWQSTLVGRIGTGIPTLVISRPAQRAYQTPENELLVFLLDEIIRLGKQTGWLDKPPTGPAAVVRTRVAEATRWSQSRMLSSVERTRPTPRAISRIRTGRHTRRFRPVLDAWTTYETLIAHLDREALRDIIEKQGLVTSSDSVLFELLCLFGALDSLTELGWRVTPLGLIEGSVQFAAARPGERIRLWYQSTPKPLTTGSLYGQALRAHGLPQSALRPDVTLRHTTADGRRNWLLVEAKMGTRRDLAGSARAALLDLLAYRRAYENALAPQAGAYGLGLAWGRGMSPANNEVMLATPDRITESMNLFLHKA